MNKARLVSLAAMIAVVVSIGLSSCQLWSNLFPSTSLGLWQQDVSYTNVPSNLPSQFRFQFQFNNDMTMAVYDYIVPPGQTQYVLFNGSYRGTYTYANGIVTMTMTEQYTVNQTTLVGTWAKIPSMTGTAKYIISGTTMFLTTDNNGDGVYDTSNPIQSIYPTGGVGATTDITYTLTQIF